MDQAYVRPRHLKWNLFQEQGAELLHRGFINNLDSVQLVNDLNELYKSMV